MCCIRKTSSSPFHFSQVFSVLSVFTQFSQFSNPISEMLQVPLFPLLPTCVSLRVPGPPPTSVVLVPEYIEQNTEHRIHRIHSALPRSNVKCIESRYILSALQPISFLFLVPASFSQLVGTVLPLGYIRRNFQASEKKKN